MFGGDAQYNIGDLYLRGVAARATIDFASKINAVYHSGIDAEPPIGSVIGGGYLEAAYNVMPLLATNSQQQLLPFVRWERYNTMSSVPTGVIADAANDRQVITAGLTYKPVYNAAFKIDWTFAKNGTDAKVPGQLALGVGYNF